MVIITENPRAAKAIAKAFNATPGKITGIFNSDDLTVIAVPQDFESTEKVKTTFRLKVSNGEIAVLPFFFCLS